MLGDGSEITLELHDYLGPTDFVRQVLVGLLVNAVCGIAFADVMPGVTLRYVDAS